MKRMKWIPGRYEETDEEIPIPNEGDKMFVGPSECGSGGELIIDRVQINDYGKCLPCNRIMVGFKGRPHSLNNYIGLLDKQKELKKQYGGIVCKECGYDLKIHGGEDEEKFLVGCGSLECINLKPFKTLREAVEYTEELYGKPFTEMTWKGVKIKSKGEWLIWE